MPLLRQHRTDRPAEPGAVGGEVEGEQPDRQQLEHRAQDRGREAEQVARDVRGELPQFGIGRRELLLQRLGRDIDVEPPGGVPADRSQDVRGGVDQLTELGHHQRDHQGHHHDGENSQAEQDHAGGHPATPPSLGQPVHRRFQGERGEQRHDDPDQQVPDLSEEREEHQRCQAHRGDRAQQHEDPAPRGQLHLDERGFAFLARRLVAHRLPRTSDGRGSPDGARIPRQPEAPAQPPALRTTAARLEVHASARPQPLRPAAPSADRGRHERPRRRPRAGRRERQG